MDNNFHKKLIPISRIVNAALADTYSNVAKSKEQFFHWCSRGAKKLQIETLKLNKRRVLLTVNHNTKTAALPPDCEEVSFVGYINEYGEKVSLGNNTNLISEGAIQDVEPEECCPKCKQDKGVCNDLEVSEEKEVVVITTTTPGITAQGAIGYITIAEVGDEGDKIEVFCNILGVGKVSLGVYENTAGDDNTTTLASNIANALSYTGFTFTSEENVITIETDSSYGSSVNEGLRIELSNYDKVFDLTFDNTFN